MRAPQIDDLSVSNDLGIMSVSGQSAARTTGRYLVTFADDAAAEGIKMLADKGGLRAASSEDFEGEEFDDERLNDANAVLLSNLGVAITDAEPDQVSALETEGGPIVSIEPEQVVYALDSAIVDATSVSSPDLAEQPPTSSPMKSQDYIRGYRDGVVQSLENLIGRSPEEEAADLDMELQAFIETTFTWGLQATRAAFSSRTGAGLGIAVLDTGFDARHPDFQGRNILGATFVSPAQPVFPDGHGHGTHCIGTACGPRVPQLKPGYGCAHQSNVLAGKVLNNAGSGADGWILAGINWAVARNSRVISMSLGARTTAAGFSFAYELAALRALARGTLIVAAAGNDSNRSAGIVRPVSRPANSPSILAVGAIDDRFRVANFSNGGIFPPYGAVDLVGPGVNVYSSFPMPGRYRRLSGTSMATPHVAGIAALWSQATGLRGRALWNRLLASARRLPLPARDVGAGLVQAP